MNRTSNIQKRIDEIKPLLAKAQDDYCHSIASGNLTAIPEQKKNINKYKKQIGKLIKERMAQ